MRLTSFIISVVFFSGIARAFPSYQSLAGWSREEVDLFIREHGEGLGAQSPPPVQQDNSSKLVHDAEHPYMAPGPNDRRGPCPGLNTLANHGVSFNVSFYTEFPLTYHRFQVSRSLRHCHATGDRNGCAERYTAPALHGRYY